MFNYLPFLVKKNIFQYLFDEEIKILEDIYKEDYSYFKLKKLINYDIKKKELFFKSNDYYLSKIIIKSNLVENINLFNVYGYHSPIELEKLIKKTNNLKKFVFYGNFTLEKKIPEYNFNILNKITILEFQSINFKVKDMLFLNEIKDLKILKLIDITFTDEGIIDIITPNVYYDMKNIKLKKLKELRLNRSQIYYNYEFIKFLKNINKLKILDISNTKIINLQILNTFIDNNSLPFLEELYMNRMGDVKSQNILRWIPKENGSYFIILGYNICYNIKGLNELVFQNFFLENKKQIFSILFGKTNLPIFRNNIIKKIEMFGNEINDFQFRILVQTLKKIEILKLNNNNITDIYIIKNLKNIKEINIKQNYISKKSIYKLSKFFDFL